MVAILIFSAVIILIALLNIFSFVGTIVMTVLVMLALIIISGYTTFGRSAAGYVLSNISKNNNYRLLVLAGITIFFFVMAVKYGGGEPLIYSALQDGKKSVSQYAGEKTKKEINYLLWGKREVSAPEKSETKHYMQGKTWFWWKAFISFFIITLFYTPFAFADETYALLKDLADRIQNLRDSVKNQFKLPPADQGAGGTSTGGPVDTSIKKFGLFAKLYSSDLASEFTIKLIQNLAKLFSRK